MIILSNGRKNLDKLLMLNKKEEKNQQDKFIKNHTKHRIYTE